MSATQCPFAYDEVIDELQGYLNQCREEVKEARRWLKHDTENFPKEDRPALIAETETSVADFQRKSNATVWCFEELHEAVHAAVTQVVNRWCHAENYEVREIGRWLADGSGLRF